MTTLLVTGADGFVGRWLVRAARRGGLAVVAAVTGEMATPTEWQGDAGIRVVTADLRDAAQVGAVAATAPDWAVHLAAVASGSAARRDPALAWQVNAGGTATLAEALVDHGTRLLAVSTGEVYGRGHAGPIAESAALEPCSAYAASKVGAEVAAMEVARRTGLEVIVARPFPHTGPGQSTRYVMGALVARLREAKARGTTQIPVGNLAPIRDMLDVRDVAEAYLALLARGTPGTAYNIASGVGHRLLDCLETLARLMGVRARPVEDASLLRPADIPVLIGDATLLRRTTGWSPAIPFDQTLQDLMHAQAD